MWTGLRNAKILSYELERDLSFHRFRLLELGVNLSWDRRAPSELFLSRFREGTR